MQGNQDFPLSTAQVGAQPREVAALLQGQAGAQLRGTLPENPARFAAGITQDAGNFGVPLPRDIVELAVPVPVDFVEEQRHLLWIEIGR